MSTMQAVTLKGEQTEALYAPPPSMEFSSEQLDLIRRTIAAEASDDELALFLYQAKRAGLDPLSRQIHLVGRYDRKAGRKVHTIQTSIDGYRLIADRTGRYAGSDDYRFDEGLECHMVAGGFDYLLKVRTRDMFEYRNFLDEKLARIAYINNTHTYVVMEEVKASHALKVRGE